MARCLLPLALSRHRSPLRPQGGFAKCYKFISLATGVECAGKVVAKTSLQKSRTKQKVSLNAWRRCEVRHFITRAAASRSVAG